MNEDRDRVGTFLYRAVPRKVARAGCSWPCHVTWDERGAYATLTRGELVLVADWIRLPAWWTPAHRGHAEELADNLARLLVALWRLYENADETGRLVIIRDGEPWRLEPGVRQGESSAGTYRVVPGGGDPGGLGWRAGVGGGWVRRG